MKHVSDPPVTEPAGETRHQRFAGVVKKRILRFAQNDGSATSGRCDGQLLHIDGGAKKSGFFAQNDKKGAAQIKTPPPQDRNEII